MPSLWLLMQVCEVTYARVQGQQALVDHFRNSKFPCADADSLPLIFRPPSPPSPVPAPSASLHLMATAFAHNSLGLTCASAFPAVLIVKADAWIDGKDSCISLYDIMSPMG